MLEPHPVAFTVELDPGPGPIRGRIARAPGWIETFAGWLEFTLALERIRCEGGRRERDHEEEK